jgi:hypothetical protein
MKVRFIDYGGNPGGGVRVGVNALRRLELKGALGLLASLLRLFP